tara:strand:+ start:5080 stop:5502 length:423 start_codon:yes stop_codon:yes gene_type:complete
MFLLFKAIHIISVIAWMAGLLYLPRLFVYHSDNKIKDNKVSSETFKVMERRLYRIIMNPSIALVWITGLYLFHLSGFETWLMIKILLVIFMTIYHIFLGQCLRRFAEGKNKFSQRFFRIINEIPTLIMIVIVFLVVFQPN